MHVIASVLALLLLVSPVGSADIFPVQLANPYLVYEKVRESVIMVLGCRVEKDGKVGFPFRMGSGVAISESVVLTARHVVEAKDWDGREIRITEVRVPVKFDKTGHPIGFVTYKVKKITVASPSSFSPGKMKEDTDLAILELDLPKDVRLSPIEIEEVNPPKGTPVLGAGYPLDSNLYISTGIISQYIRITYWGYGEDEWKLPNEVLTVGYTASTAPGSSGGPVFNEAGRLVGVHVASNRAYAGFYYGIPAETIREFVTAFFRK